jgi:hypothetical protein
VRAEPAGELSLKGFSKPVGVHSILALREAGA